MALPLCPETTSQMLSHVCLFVAPQTVACQAPLSIDFSRQVAIPVSRGSSPPGIKPSLLHCSWIFFFTICTTREALTNELSAHKPDLWSSDVAFLSLPFSVLSCGQAGLPKMQNGVCLLHRHLLCSRLSQYRCLSICTCPSVGTWRDGV